MTRREFLKAGLALAMGGLAMTAAAETFSTRTIDFHAHAILPSYVDALRVLKKFMMLANGTLEKFPNNSTCR